ncbi:hypothetical protein VPHD148_0131 [Vibrio phage D148]
MSSVKKRTFKIHIFDLIAAMVFIGKKVTPEDLANHFYNENWADADKYEVLDAVKVALDREMGLQKGKRSEDHYGFRENNGAYWLDYRINEY